MAIKRFINRDGRVWDHLLRQFHKAVPGMSSQELVRFLNSASLYQVKDIDYLKVRLEPYELEVLTECCLFPSRNWMADGIIYSKKTNSSTHVVIEIEGLGGRHQSIGGFLGDMEKYNAATVLGYKLLRFTTADLLTDYPVKCILALLKPFVHLEEFSRMTVKKERK